MTNAWSTYFDNHPSRDDYNKNCKSIATLINTKESILSNFRLLSENPTLTVMFKSQLDSQIQTIHSCSIIGNTVINNPRFMGLIGFSERAIPVQIAEKSLDPSSPATIPSPTFLELMKVRSTNDVDELNKTSQNNKKKIKLYCVLPPFLTQCLYSGSNDPKQVLVKFVNEVTNMSTSSIVNESETVQTNTTDMEDDSPSKLSEDEPSKNSPTVNQQQDITFTDPSGEVEENFYHILLFLWAMTHKSDKLPSLTAVPATDKEASDWSDIIHFTNLKQPPPTGSFTPNSALADGIARATSEPDNEESMVGVAAALQKVAYTMNRDIEVKLTEKREATQKATYKNFNALSQLTQTTICTASAYVTTPDDDEFDHDEEERQISIPPKPTKFLLETIACTTGASAKEHLHHHLHGNMIDVDIGMCTSIKNAIFLSQPTASDINIFSINFVSPPTDDPEMDFERNENARIAETSRNGKLTYADVEKQTKHKNKYAKNYNDLKHFTKNWADLNEKLWSKRAILSRGLRVVSNHVERNEEEYRRAFAGSEYFGAFFQQKIHTATQKYLRSCAHGDPGKLNIRTLEFTNLLESVEDDDIVVKIPSWVKTKKPE